MKSTVIAHVGTPNTDLSDVVVYLDLNNTGSLGTNPSTTSNLLGNAYFTDLDPVAFYDKGNNKASQVIVRQVTKAGFIQDTPSGSLGCHVPLVAGQESKCSFINKALPANQVRGMILGINFGGVTNPAYDPVKHPELLAVYNQIAFDGVRAWLTQDFTKPLGSDQTAFFANFKGARTANAGTAPASNILVLNLIAKGWDDTVALTAFFNSFPLASVANIAIVEFGNEIQNKKYWAGTRAQYDGIVKLGSPILRAKGYLIALANDYFPSSINDHIHSGLVPYANIMGLHCYSGNPKDYDTQSLVGKTLVNVQRLTYIATEGWGHSVTPATWPAQTTTVIQNCRRSGINMYYFQVLFQEGEQAGGEALLDSNYKQTPFVQAILDGLK